MDATCTIQDSIHVFSLVHKYVSRILGTYHISVTYNRFAPNPTETEAIIWVLLKLVL